MEDESDGPQIEDDPRQQRIKDLDELSDRLHISFNDEAAWPRPGWRSRTEWLPD
jgi:hypothetical protein